MSKRAVAVFAGAVLWWLAAPLTALAAEPCPPLDITCQVDDVIDQEPGPGPIDDVTNPTDEIVDEVEPIVDDVGEVVDDLLGGGGVIDPPGGGVIDLPGGGDGGDHGSGPGTGRPRDGDPRNAPGPDAVVATASREGGSATDIVPAAAGGTREQPVGSARPPGGIVQAAITGALLLLGLLLVTVGFVLLQDRLDRSDPKLAIAPVRADLVRFE